MIELKKSPVVFTEEPHGYFFGPMRLSGITSLIHAVLGLGNYPDASEYVKTTLIPRAGDYGTAVHHAIETYDTTGVKETQISGKFDVYDVTREIENYISHQQGFKPLANEYTVSDYKWASNIDNIWLNDAGLVWLIDTKTNNTKYYPGGVEGLKEYLSWQLSIYAYLFELQNPGLQVAGLACNWLRKDEHEFWKIERIDNETVKELLDKSDYTINNDGTFTYTSTFVNHRKSVVEAEQKIVPVQFINNIVVLANGYEEVKKSYDNLKTELRATMEKFGLKSWDAGPFKATIASDSTTNTFDSAKFKKDHPELYAQYCTEKVKKGGFTIKLR